MSHQTGIKAGQELKDVFCQCTTEGNIRLVKMNIVDEVLTCTGTVEKKSNNWRDEYEDCVLQSVERDSACYMLFQLNNMSEWAFIAYTPDSAKVRDKMMYSGTRATAKQEFGGGFIVDELIGTEINDITLAGYDAHKKGEKVPAPLTDREEELKQMKAEESNSEISITTRHQTVQGLAFPLTSDLIDALHRFRDGSLNFLQLSVDTDKELITLASSANYRAGELERAIHKEQPFYYVYRYSHTYNGKDLAPLLFIYAMPGYKCPIKARMLFSSCKGPLLEDLEQQFGLKFEKRLEIQDDKVTENYLNEEFHPPVIEEKEKFSKPKAPGRRAPTRRTRPTE